MPTYVRVEWTDGTDRVLSTAVEVGTSGDGITIARDYYPDNASYANQITIAWSAFTKGYYMSDGSAIVPPE